MTANSWTAEWIDSEISGVPAERYYLTCVGPTETCNSTPMAQSDEVARGLETAVVNGLQKNMLYQCFAVAQNNFGSACSAPVFISTESEDPVPPPADNSYYVDQTSTCTEGCGDENNPYPTFAGAMDAIPEDSGFYRIVFLGSDYIKGKNDPLKILKSNLEITSENTQNPCAITSDNGEFTGNDWIFEIDATVADVYIHHLRLNQRTKTTNSFVINFNRSPTGGNAASQIIEDWPQDVCIYRNILEFNRYGKRWFLRRPLMANLGFYTLINKFSVIITLQQLCCLAVTCKLSIMTLSLIG